MFRATTPTHFFELPEEYKNIIDKIVVTYSQNSNVVLEKTERDGTFSEGIFYYELTQEETNLFSENTMVELQLRIKTKDGKVSASDVYWLPVNRVLNDEVL